MPFGKVQDFSPYVAKIKASGAQSVVTGNYNRDLNLLIKAAVDDGLNVRFDTFLAHLIGGPTAIGAAGENRLTSVMEFNGNVRGRSEEAGGREDRHRLAAHDHDTDFSTLNFLTMIDMLADAINKAGSTDPLKVALALEDMHYKDLDRPGKHHAQGRPPVADAVLCRRLLQGREIRLRAYRLRLEELHDGDRRRPDLPTICKMKRPE